MIIRQSDEIMVEAQDVTTIFRFGIMRTLEGFKVALRINCGEFYKPITRDFDSFNEAYKVFASSITSVLDYEKINPHTKVTVIRMR